MAERIIGFRMKILGEKDTFDQIALVEDALKKASKSITLINKKSDDLEKTTKRIDELTKSLNELNKSTDGVKNLAIFLNELNKASSFDNKQADKQKRVKTEIDKTREAQAKLIKELEGTEKGTAQYQALLETVAKAKAEKAALTREIKNQQKTFEGIKLAVGSYRQLDFQLQQLRARYKEISQAERESGAGREMLRNIQNLDRQLKQMDASIGQYQRNVGNYVGAFGGFKTAVQQVAAATGVILGVDEIIRNNAQISDSIGDVRRVTQLGEKQVENLYQALRKLDTRTSLNALLDISTIGGKLGVSEKNLAGFTAQADKLQVALGKELGSNIEETTTKLSKLVTIFSDDKEITGDKLLNIGNAIAYLSNKGTASGEFLADFSNRLAGLAGIAPVTLGQTLGLGAGFEELGQSSEVASTAVNQLILKIGQDIPHYAALAGKSTEEFAKTINSNPVEALIQLSEGLSKNKNGFSEISEAFKDAEAKGVRVTQTLGVLGKNADFFREKIAQGSEALTRQNDILDAYEVKNNTAGAAWDKFKKSIVDATTSTEVQAWLVSIFEGLSKLVQILGGLPKFIKENKLEIIALVGAYLTLNSTLIETTKAKIVASSAYGLLTDATKRQEIATNLLNKVQSAVPILLVVAAIYTALKAYNAWSERIDATRIASQKLADAKKQIIENTASEIAKVQQNINILKSELTSKEQRKAAIDALNQQYPSYLKNIDLEKASVGQLQKLQDDLTASIIKTQAARLKQQATDEIATQIVQKQLRRDQVAAGAELTTGESLLGRGVVQSKSKVVTTGFGQTVVGNEDIRKGAVQVLDSEVAELNKALIKTGEDFDKAFGLVAQTSTQATKTANKNIQSIGQSAEFESKEDKKRKDKAAKALKKEEDDRIKEERAAAENIARLRQQLIDKTFEGQKLAAVAERNEALKTSKGNKEQVDEQKKLLDELLTKRLNTINEAYEAERKAALQDIAEKRRQFAERQAANTVGNIQASGAAQNRVFQLDEIKVTSDFTAKEKALQDEYQKRGIFTEGSERKLTEQLKALETEREQALLTIRKQAFEFNKTQKATELQAQQQQLITQRDNNVAAIDQQFAQERERLDQNFRNKLITEQEYQEALKAIEEQAQADKEQAETDYQRKNAEFAQNTALESIKSAQDIADAELKIVQDKNDQIAASNKRTVEQEKAIQSARLDLLGTFVSGAKDLLGQDEANRKKYSGVLKALALAEIAINLQRELSAIAAAAGANVLNIVTFGVAGATQYSIQSAVAIARAGFAAARVLTQKFEYGGVEPQGVGTVEGGRIPQESGIITGRSHTEGGVKVLNRFGNFYEVEGGEYRLRNGRETYIINKRSTGAFKSELDTLAKIVRPSLFSPLRKMLASSINAQHGRKFAVGGIEPGLPFNTPLVGAPLPPTSGFVVVNGDPSPEVLSLILETQRMVAAVNNRIDRLTVKVNAEDVYDAALEQKELKSTQTL